MYSTTPLRSAPMVTKTASGEFARVARARFSSMGVELPSTTHSHVEVRVRVLSVQRREPCPSCSKQTSAHILSLCTRRKSNDITFLQAVFATRFGQSDGHSPTALSSPVHAYIRYVRMILGCSCSKPTSARVPSLCARQKEETTSHFCWLCLTLI